MGFHSAPNSDEFYFDEATHTYYLHGEKIPSVTQILAALGVLPVPPKATEYHRKKGSLIHLGCEYVDRGTWNEEGTTEELRPYIHAYELFTEEYGFEPELSEHATFSPILRVAGMLDRWGTYHRKTHRPRCLVDFKTGSLDPGHYIQIALYEILLLHREKKTTDARFIVQLQKNGLYRVHEGRSQDKRDALSILNTYQWLKGHNRIGE